MLTMNYGRLLFTRLGHSSAIGAAGGGTLLLSSMLFQQQNQPKQSSVPNAISEPNNSPSVTMTTPNGNSEPPNATFSTKEAAMDLAKEIARAMSRSSSRATAEAPVKLSRKILSEGDKTGLDLRLYQYQTCPYCCKVRAFFDYFGFSYEVVEVNPVTRSQIKFSKTYKKVPILTTFSLDQPLIESSLIISMLATFLVRPELSLSDLAPMYPEDVKKDGKKEIVEHLNKYYIMWSETPLTDAQIQDAREEREWREWVDDTFIHLISPNVYRTFPEALATFRWFEQVGDWQQNFPTWERWMAVYVGAAAMWGISKRLKKRHNITDEREAMRKAFQKFLQAKGPDRKFLGGDQPNLADLALYGACNSFYGCETFAEMRQQIPSLGDWFDAVDAAVKNGQGKHLIEEKSRFMAGGRHHGR